MYPPAEKWPLGATEGGRYWNPRYVCYAIAAGYADPAEILERDTQNHPGGCMMPFILWNSQQWLDWGAERPEGMPKVKSQEHHDEYDSWLYDRAIRGECCEWKP